MEREFSFVHAMSFAMMLRGSAHDALTFESGFTAADFVELR